MTDWQATHWNSISVVANPISSSFTVPWLLPPLQVTVLAYSESLVSVLHFYLSKAGSGCWYTAQGKCWNFLFMAWALDLITSLVSCICLFSQRCLHEPGAQILPPLVFLFILYNNKNTGVFLVGSSPRSSSWVLNWNSHRILSLCTVPERWDQQNPTHKTDGEFHKLTSAKDS